MKHVKRRGFTLIELLVVIGIVVLLLSILLPALGKARDSARTIRCANSERQILDAMFMYANSNRQWLPLPPLYRGGAQLGGVQIWMPGLGSSSPTPYVYDYQNGTIWPYIGLNDVAGREHLFTCPADDLLSYGSSRNFTYTFNWELYKTPFDDFDALVEHRQLVRIGVRLPMIKGTDHKILVLEAAAPLWECSGFLVQPGATAFDGELSKRHSQRANIGMADGHVELLDPGEINTLTTVKNGPSKGFGVPAKYDYYCSLLGPSHYLH